MEIYGVNLPRLAWMLARTLLAAWVGLSVFMYFMQSHYVYYPDKDILFTPADSGLEYEDVFFAAEDGTRLHGWFVPAKEARGTVLVFHGNAGNIGDRLPIIESFVRMRLNVFIVDYRGYGKSAGAPSEKGTQLDALAAWEYLDRDRGINPSSILIAGRSLGGAVACRLASQKPAGGLLLEATFTSLPDLAAKIYPYLPVRLLCRFKYDSINAIREVKCPVMVAHSPDDEMIPFSHGKKLFEAAPEPRYFQELKGRHNDGEMGLDAEYRKALEKFLALILDNT